MIMTLAELVLLALKSSISVLVFTIGLGTRPKELVFFFRHPRQLIRSLISMNLVMPVIAVVIVIIFPLHPSVEITLVALAFSPVPPILPKKLVKAGGGHAYVMALLFSAALFALISIPIGSVILDAIFPAKISVPVGPLVPLILATVIVPTIAGVTVRFLAPNLATRIERPLSAAATGLLLLAAVLILIKAGPMIIAQIGNGTFLVLAAFVILGRLVGHLLGGPTAGDRSVLALATASRHPGIAMAMGHLVYPAEKAVPATIMLYLLISIAISIPYVRWRRHAVSDTPVESAPDL